MNTKLTLIVWLALFLFQPVSAQIQEVVVTVWGEFEVVLQVGNRGTVVVTSEGEIVEIDMEGAFSYNDEGRIFTDDANRNKVSKVGGVEFTYYDDRKVFTDPINRGKIAKIGNIEFTYYDDRKVFTDEYNRGKIARIDRIDFNYYDSRKVFRDSYNIGKIESIGCTKFVYYDERNHRSAPEYCRGMIAEIENKVYTYYDLRYESRKRGIIKSGEKSFKSCNGFELLVWEPAGHRKRH